MFNTLNVNTILTHPFSHSLLIKWTTFPAGGKPYHDVFSQVCLKNVFLGSLKINYDADGFITHFNKSDIIANAMKLHRSAVILKKKSCLPTLIFFKM